MTATESIVQLLYNLVKGSSLAEAVTGGVYKAKRPKDSRQEDICLSVRANQFGQRQEAIAYVNIYVQDVERSGQAERATARHKELEALAVALLERGYGGGYRYEMDSMTVEETETNENVISIRILFQLINE